MTEKSEKKKPAAALVHGLYAKDVLLPWDSKEDFEKLHDDLKAELFPCGRAEEETVLDLANMHWRKHTLWRMRMIAVLKDPFTQDILETEQKSWAGIRKRLRAAAKSEHSLLGGLEATVTHLQSRIQRLQKKLSESSDTEEIKVREQTLDACMRVFGERAIPLLHKLKQGPDAEQAFDNAYVPECLEKMERLEAALDARIAKLLARLVGLKEFKRTAAAHLLPPSPRS